MNKSIVLSSILLLLPISVYADWQVITHTDTNTNTATQVAYTDNDQGYSLEIYRDSVNAVRARFSINRALDKLVNKHCPTFQVDNRLLDNRSINDAVCITDLAWSEFVLGYVIDNSVSSAKLNALVNGSTITFRFMLESGTYEETNFSLSGSKRATLTVLGGSVVISP